MCKETGLDRSDMEDMTVGGCIDYIDKFIEMKNPDGVEKARKAGQKDFDQF